MNFYDNIPNFNPHTQMQNMNNPIIMNNDINYKINELETKIKRLEQRISRLEVEKSSNNYIEPDNSLYMI